MDKGERQLSNGILSSKCENPGYICGCAFLLYQAYIWMPQASQQATSFSWELVYTAKCKQLMKMVKERRARIRRKTYQEKLDSDFTPFNSMKQVPRIEEHFWKHGNNNFRSCFPGLRNRFTFLQCYSGLLRSESLFLGELSDVFGLAHKRRKDPHEMYIMVSQITTGKFFSYYLCIVYYCLFFSTFFSLLLLPLNAVTFISCFLQEQVKR